MGTEEKNSTLTDAKTTNGDTELLGSRSIIKVRKIQIYTPVLSMTSSIHNDKFDIILKM